MAFELHREPAMRTVLLPCFTLLSFCGGAFTAEPREPKKAEEPLVKADFEDPDARGLYKTLVRNGHLDVVDNKGVNGSRALRATYEGYKRGSKRITARHSLPKKVGRATLVFDVMFDRDFQFVKGGKLNGLGPDRPITGGSKMKPDGWSARVMWRRGGGLNSYVYSQNKKGKYGEKSGKTAAFLFKKETYYAVSIHVKLNDPVTAENGFMHVFVNGRPVVRHEGIQFRKVGGDRTLISKFLFSSFHGGHSRSWAPKKKDGGYATVHAYFDNIAVYEGPHVRKRPGQRQRDE